MRAAPGWPKCSWKVRRYTPYGGWQKLANEMAALRGRTLSSSSSDTTITKVADSADGKQSPVKRSNAVVGVV